MYMLNILNCNLCAQNHFERAECIVVCFGHYCPIHVGFLAKKYEHDEMLSRLQGLVMCCPPTRPPVWVTVTEHGDGGTHLNPVLG